MATRGDHAGALAVLAALAAAGCIESPRPAPSCGTDDRLAQLAIGRDHACARLDNGGVWCWGQNDQGQIGDPRLIDSSTPVQVAGLSKVVEVAVGQDHSCARLESGAVRCWGSGSDGQLGDGSADDTAAEPVAVDGLDDAVALALGDDFSCALDSSGVVWCWGENEDGQLGDDTVVDHGKPAPVAWPDGAGRALQIGLGQKHGCALTDEGRVLCWGTNVLGQLGDGTQVDHHVPTETSDFGVAVTIAVGGFHACAVDELGGTWCWGATTRGQVGQAEDNLEDDCASDEGPLSCLPVPVPLPERAQLVSAGREHTCAAVEGGSVLCWGSNEEGQLGDGGFADTHEPTPLSVPVPSPVVALESGETQSCSVSADREISCWGGNHAGQLGQTAQLTSPRPGRASRAGSGDLIEAGDAHTCVVRGGDEIWCWGRNTDGQLGDGTEQSRSEAVMVTGEPGSGVTGLALGAEHTCAAGGDGVTCWGGNANGESLPGGAEDILAPAAATIEVENVSAVSAGDEHTCAIDGGDLWCWGADDDGQLGDGGEPDDDAAGGPLVVADLVPVMAAAGGDHTCAIDGGGAVVCWGRNDAGQLGDGTTQLRTAPGAAVVLGGRSAVEIGAGDLFSCALLEDGAVRCWGDNEFGQLGDGTTEEREEPARAVELPGAAERLFVGNEHVCVLLDTALEPYCWGRNSSGQLGTGGYESTGTPAPVELPGSVVGMGLGEQHTCALVDQGEDAAAIWCWGSDVDGKLASARPLQFPTAVAGPTVCP